MSIVGRTDVLFPWQKSLFIWIIPLWLLTLGLFPVNSVALLEVTRKIESGGLINHPEDVFITILLMIV